MKLIVGLGNPGKKYEQNRHNVGFMAVEGLAEKYGGTFKKKRLRHSWVAHSLIEGEKVTLAKPTTYMNLSGSAVKVLLKKTGLKPSDLIVTYDDKDLALGELRLRAGGGSGGHNGLKSVIEVLRTDQFPRIRIGIQGEDRLDDTAGYVLSNFKSSEKKVLNDVLGLYQEMVACLIRDGIDKAMSLYNKKHI